MIRLIFTILVRVCVEKLLYTKVNKIYIWVFTLTTQEHIHIKIEIFFNGLSKTFINMLKMIFIIIFFKGQTGV